MRMPLQLGYERRLQPSVSTGLAQVLVKALIGSIRFAAFDQGTDTYTYAGVGAGAATGDDTMVLEFVPDQVVDDGDMFTVTGDSGDFRALYISLSGNYETIIPEPATLGLLAISLLSIAASRHKF